MLEDVVVPARRNVDEDVYGFVRYSNVRDVCKLLKAVNSVCFRNFNIVAKVARFDRAAGLEVAKGCVDGGGAVVVRKDTGLDGDGGAKSVGKVVVKEVNESKVASEGGKVTKVESVEVGKGLSSETVFVEGEGKLAKVRDSTNGARLGDVMVSMQQSKPCPKKFVSAKKGSKFGVCGYSTDHKGKPSIQKLVRNYKSCKEDIQWASKGVVASVVNGEFIPDVQNRIADAGFSDIEITPMGADRVLIRSSSDVLVHTIINDAKEFFDHFFKNIVRWEKKILPFQRGAWLRIYGVPIHAWNVSFFKLCVLDCGRYLRTDVCSVEKERFDYARVLVATPSFEILNCSEVVLIDRELVSVKIIEEWGFNIGDDACLYEEEDEVRETQSDQEEDQVDHVLDGKADSLVDKLVNDLVGLEGQRKLSEEVGSLVGSESSFDACEGSISKQKTGGAIPVVNMVEMDLSKSVALQPIECASSTMLLMTRVLMGVVMIMGGTRRWVGMVRRLIFVLVVMRRLRGDLDDQGRCLAVQEQIDQLFPGRGAWNGLVINITVRQGSYLHLENVLKVGVIP